MPCPISTWGMISVVLPAPSMRMKALGAKAPSASGFCTGASAARTGRWKASSTLPARPPESRLRREGAASVTSFSPSAFGRRALDRGADAHVRAATADIARHGRIDVGIVRLGRGREQRRCRHDLAGLAVAALDDLEVEPCLLDLCTGRGSAHAFDGGHGAVAHRAHRQHTGAYRLAVQMYRAGAALRD